MTQTLSYSFTGLTTAPAFTLAWGRDFQLAPPSCTLASTTTCTVAVTFAPIRPGLRQDYLSVKTQSGTLLAGNSLHGIGLAPMLVPYPGIINTLAGNPSTTQLYGPQGVTLDPSGANLLVADTINGVIRKIALSSGAITTVAGNFVNAYTGDGGPATSASLNTPMSVASDSAGNLYIADQGNNVIRRVDAVTQNITTIAGGGTTPTQTDTYGDGGPATSAILNGPASVAVDVSGNVYLADTYHQLVRVVNASTGIISVVAGGGNSAGTDGLGDGVAATSATLANPSGIALDSSGNLYIADSGNNMIRRVDSNTGIITAVAGNGAWGFSGDHGLAVNAQLANPQAVAIDAAGNLYIADYANNAIRLVSAANRQILTVAGRVSSGFSGDGGDPTVAFLTSPMGIAVDENGNLYIGDNGNNVVRQVTFSPVSLTFASQTVGLVSYYQLVSPFNAGNQTLNFTGLAIAANFQQTATLLSDCTAATTLAAGASCNLGISFAPTQSGTLTGIAALSTNSLAGSSPLNVSLSGVGAAGPSPQISFSAGTLSFSPQLVSTSSAAQTVTVLNSGGAALTIVGMSLSGAQVSDYQMTSSCGASLAAGASCTVTVVFTPTGSGTRSAVILFNDLLSGSPQGINLFGAGLSGTASVSTSSLSFSSLVDVTSAAQTVTLTNTGTYALPLQGMSISGAGASVFAISGSCPVSLAAGASCTVSIAFTPTAPGAATATLNIFDDAGTSPQSVALAGTGTSVIPSSGLRFVPMTPCRVADTRNANGPFGGPILTGGVARSFVIPSSLCGVPSTAQAYSLNFTIVPPSWVGYLSVYPTGQSQPLVSLLNSDGRIKANAAILPAGSGGAITVYSSNNTHVIIDINGYFVPATNLSALAFYPVTPCRIADTRQTTHLVGGTPRTFSPLTASCGIPSTAQAYSLNLTAIPISPIGYLSIWPAGQSQPLVSTLNTGSLEVTANAAVVPAGTNGGVTVYSSDSTDLAIDINGYFAPATTTGALSLFSVTPCRVLDTRLGAGAFSGTIAVNVTGSACAPPAAAQAFVLNATVVPAASLGFLSLWQDGAAWPVSSILNADDEAITSNMGIIPTSNGSVDALASGPTNLILDISAYFAP